MNLRIIPIIISGTLICNQVFAMDLKYKIKTEVKENEVVIVDYDIIVNDSEWSEGYSGKYKYAVKISTQEDNIVMIENKITYKDEFLFMPALTFKNGESASFSVGNENEMLTIISSAKKIE